MSVAGILREKAMQVVPLALFVNLIANFARLLFMKTFTKLAAILFYLVAV